MSYQNIILLFIIFILIARQKSVISWQKCIINSADIAKFPNRFTVSKTFYFPKYEEVYLWL